MPLDKIVGINFQTHERIVVELDKHITTIIGPNDVGKSAILRLLRWVCLNQPSGAEFVKWDSTHCTGKLYLDGHIIVRKRGDKINTYALDKREFKSFGVGNVPDEIAKILRLSSLNFQGQIDPPFWLTDSAGEVSRQLNQIVNLGAVDQALSAASSEVRRAHAEVEITQDRLVKAQKERDDLKWVPTMAQSLAELETQEAELSKVSQDVATLGSMIERGKTLTRTRTILQNASKTGQNIVGLGTNITKVRGRRESLEVLLRRLKTAERLAKQSVPDMGPLLAIRTQGDEAAERRRDLEHFLSDLKVKRREKCQAQKELTAAEQELAEAKKRVRVCPTCGQVVKPK